MNNKSNWLIICGIAVASWHGFDPLRLQFVGSSAKTSRPSRLDSQLGWTQMPQEITIKLSGSESASEVLETLKAEQGNPALNLICVNAAWVAIANLQNTVTPQVATDPYFKEFLDITVRLLEEALVDDASKWGRACSNMFWAVGTLKAQRLMRPSLDAVQDALGNGVAASSYFMNAQEVTNAIWACGKLELSTSRLHQVLNALGHRLPDVAEALDPQQLSNIVWAAAKLGRAAPQLQEAMPLMAEVMPEKIDAFEPQHVSSSLLSISQLPRNVSIPLLDMLPKMLIRATEVLDKMNGQMVANTCWGLAVCGHLDARLCSATKGILHLYTFLWLRLLVMRDPLLQVV